MNPLRTTVLISGSGSNLQALIDARKSGELDINIVNVISNVPSARGLERAGEAGVPSTILEHGRFADRNEFEQSARQLRAAGYRVD